MSTPKQIQNPSWLTKQNGDEQNASEFNAVVEAVKNNAEVQKKQLRIDVKQGFTEAEKQIGRENLGIDLGSGGLGGLPTVHVKFVEDRINFPIEVFKVFARVDHPNPEAFKGKINQVWIFRPKYRRGGYPAPYHKNYGWAHINEIRKPESVLHGSKYYGGGYGGNGEFNRPNDETRRTEWDVPVFNEWFELENFTFFEWFLGHYNNNISHYYDLDPHNPPPEFDDVGDYTGFKAKGRNGKTQSIKFAYVMLYQDENGYYRDLRGSLSNMYRIGMKYYFNDDEGKIMVKPRVFHGNYIPMGRAEEKARYKPVITHISGSY